MRILVEGCGALKQAPRIDRRIVRALGNLDDPTRPIAETSRRAGALAAELGLPRPSYEQIRVELVYVGSRPPRALFDDDT